MLGALRQLQRALPAAALLTVSVIVGACGSGHAHSTAVSSPTNPVTPSPTTHHGDDSLSSMFEGANQLMMAPGPTLDVLRQLGVDRIRVDVYWRQIAPDATRAHPPAGFDATAPASYPASAWAPFDQVFEQAAAHGIGVLATVRGPAPEWAEEPGDPHQAGEPPGVWKPSPAAFGAFVRAVGTRYDGRYTPPGASHPLPRISFWSVWNEPNDGQDLAPQAREHSTIEVAPSLYRGLLDAGWSGLHATGHGHDTILFGETAPHGQSVGNVPGNFGLMVPLRFLRALYCVNGSFQRLTGSDATDRGCPAGGSAASFRGTNPALFRAGGLAAHLYPIGPQPPTEPVADEPDDGDFGALPEIERTLDSAQAAYGDDTRLPIYSTEFGYHTDPPEPYMARPALAAEYLNEAEYLSWLNPRMRSYDQYLLEDPPTSASAFDTGLVFYGGHPKATFDAFRLPLYLPQTTQTAGGSLEVWGDVRPAHFYSTKSVEIEFARGASAAYTPVRTLTPGDPEGYFDALVRFPASGTVRLAWSYPGGPEVYSRTVSVVVR
ncbi:MAG TPA: hypothetical protein VG223_09725 [Solirubrobacteraceae bacterium]|nr:hypothetical protein [Solirubrobacteraceae bacterium]